MKSKNCGGKLWNLEDLKFVGGERREVRRNGISRRLVFVAGMSWIKSGGIMEVDAV